MRIGIIDYGMGNLHSVKGALEYIGLNNFISNDKTELAMADALILPGVGAFPDAMECLNRLELTDFIRSEIIKKPLLGICLGMQLLFDRSFEFRECSGLGLIRGDVIKLTKARKIPHMGWNSLRFLKDSQLCKELPEQPYVYFVHSFKGEAAKRSDILAVTDYDEEVCAMVESGNVYGTQFHPEKSESIGLTILKNFGGIL